MMIDSNVRSERSRVLDELFPAPPLEASLRFNHSSQRCEVHCLQCLEGEVSHDDDVCAICLEPIGASCGVTSGYACKHAFHHNCLMKWITSGDHNDCPECRKPLWDPLEYDRILNRQKDPQKVETPACGKRRRQILATVCAVVICGALTVCGAYARWRMKRQRNSTTHSCDNSDYSHVVSVNFFVSVKDDPVGHHSDGIGPQDSLVGPWSGCSPKRWNQSNLTVGTALEDENGDPTSVGFSTLNMRSPDRWGYPQLLALTEGLFNMDTAQGNSQQLRLFGLKPQQSYDIYLMSGNILNEQVRSYKVQRTHGKWTNELNKQQKVVDNTHNVNGNTWEQGNNYAVFSVETDGNGEVTFAGASVNEEPTYDNRLPLNGFQVVETTTRSISILPTICPNVPLNGSSLSELSVTGNSPAGVAGVEAGQYFQISANALTEIVGYRRLAISENKPNLKDVKRNDGGVFRVTNHRNKRTGSVLIWYTEEDVAIGSWNPTDRSKVEDWMVGDALSFIDFDVSRRPRDPALPVTEYTTLSDAGWNLQGNAVQFGQAGLVGDWWEQLEIQYDFAAVSQVSGIWSDSDDVPYTVSFFDNDNMQWKDLNGTFTGTVDLPVFETQQVRLFWNDTNFKQLSSGMSTYRGGGGIHAEPTGIVNC